MYTESLCDINLDYEYSLWLKSPLRLLSCITQIRVWAKSLSVLNLEVGRHTYMQVNSYSTYLDSMPTHLD